MCGLLPVAASSPLAGWSAAGACKRAACSHSKRPSEDRDRPPAGWMGTGRFSRLWRVACGQCRWRGRQWRRRRPATRCAWCSSRRSCRSPQHLTARTPPRQRRSTPNSPVIAAAFLVDLGRRPNSSGRRPAFGAAGRWRAGRRAGRRRPGRRPQVVGEFGHFGDVGLV